MSNGDAIAEHREVGAQRRPRILVGWSGADSPADELEAMGLEVQRIGHVKEVHLGDYHVLFTNTFASLISTGSASRHSVPYDAAPHLFVVTFGSDIAWTSTVDQWDLFVGEHRVEASRPSDRSERFTVAGDLSQPLADLVHDHLLPKLQEGIRNHTVFRVIEDVPGSGMVPSDSVRPWVTSSAGNVLAGAYSRGGVAEGWVLPHDTPHKTRWLVAALQLWADVGVWPPPGEWQRRARWRTSAERQLDQELEDLRAERAAAEARFASREADLARRLEVAERDAAVGDKRLLEGKGSQLANAVGDAFRALGYDVEDLDSTTEAGNRKEDYRLVDPDRAGTVLVEVKGYDGGVRAVDLRRVGRHADRARLEGVDVAGVWWVVNHTRRTAPEDRPRPLASDEDALREDADEYGLVVIETHDLFEVLQRVRAGEVDPSAVRADLASAKGGRWKPSGDVGDAPGVIGSEDEASGGDYGADREDVAVGADEHGGDDAVGDGFGPHEERPGAAGGS